MSEAGASARESERGLFLALKTSPANRRELLLALEEFRQRALTEPGCTACQVLEDTSDVNHFLWTEWWRDEAWADQAMERPRFRALLGAIQLLGAVEDLEWLGRRTGPAVLPSYKR